MKSIKNLIQKYKFFIYPLLVVASSIVIILFLIIPQAKVLFTGQGKLNDSQVRLNILEVKVEELESLDKSDLSQKLSLTLTALPTEKDFATLIGIFKNLATTSGMSLTSLHLAGGSESQNAFLVKADLIGTTSSIGQLLENIEKSPRVMKVQSVETSSSSIGNIVSAVVTVLVYFEAAPKTLGPIDSALPKLTETDQTILGTLARSGSLIPSGAVSLPSGKANPFYYLF